MKNMKKIFAMILAITMIVLAGVIPASAKGTIDDYKKSVVWIVTTVQFEGTNSGHNFTYSSSGTGFAVGMPGEPVQHIATAAHVVSEPSGVYTLYIDPTTNAYVDYEAMPAGTAYPATGTYAGYTTVTDYFETTPVEILAVYSNASNDYTSLTIVQIDSEKDVAVCKLAGEPTEKISALPLMKKEHVEVNTDILALGYASTSSVFNDEAKMDSSDVTVKDGIVSKITRTKGMSGSEVTYDALEVTAELTTGMSGGPVIVEDNGAIIGVNAFLAADSSQVAAARYATCIDYLCNLLDTEGVPYELVGGGLDLTMILIIAAIVVLIAAVVVIIIIATKKKSAPAPAPTPVVDNGGQTNFTPTTPAATKYYLLGITGPMAGKKFSLTDRAIIGRDKVKCNVVFAQEQPGVSGVHCEVKVVNGTMTLKDCGSSYGTFLANGTKLDPNVPVVLQSGSTFWVGSKENTFEVRY